MPDHFLNIYNNEAVNYERLIAREDQHGNLFQTVMEIHPFDGAVVAEFGAGTGRFTRILSVLAKHIYACDFTFSMLQEGQRVLTETGMENWSFVQGDNRAMPLATGFADIAIEGWSFGHARGWSPNNWQNEIDRMIGEMQRVLKPSGTMILVETMGTGQKQPQAPSEHLAELFAYFEQAHGFNYRWIRTDYNFQSVAEADELIRFFFGDEMADKQVASKNTIVPECTGIWWKHL
jgi:ubiquinone/menaquinone biosynthesis C-methylase UbiE